MPKYLFPLRGAAAYDSLAGIVRFEQGDDGGMGCFAYTFGLHELNNSATWPPREGTGYALPTRRMLHRAAGPRTWPVASELTVSCVKSFL
jgi:hypothetical protein